MDWRAEYERLLRETLCVPSHAERAVTCIYEPSFHPECAITLVESDASLTIRTLTRSVWTFFNARRHATELVDWVEPALAVERCGDAVDETLRTLAGACRSEARAGPAGGLDGMIVAIEIADGTEIHRRERWVGSDADACIRLASALHAAALSRATTDASRAGLGAITRYFPRGEGAA